MIHLYKIKEVKDKCSMDMVTIGDLLLGVKVVRMWKGRSSIIFIEDGMCNINVGPNDKIMVVKNYGGNWTNVVNRTSVVNRTRSLTCPTR